MPHDRSRLVSLSIDWENIVKDSIDEKQKRLMEIFLSGGGAICEREKVFFLTGSSYVGKWNALGMAVYGTYLYPQGCEYEGAFSDGRFHGVGTLTYPMGQKLEGIWEKGKMVSYNFSNVDGLDYTYPWPYCRFPDRRFNVSHREGLQPAGREFLTNQQPTRPVLPEMYDVGDGFFNAEDKTLIEARDPEDYKNLEMRDSIVIEPTEDDFWMHSISMVTKEREGWIKHHCRRGMDVPAGYRPDLYLDWITGRKRELREMEIKYNSSEPTKICAEISGNEIISESYTTCSEEESSFVYAGTGRKLTNDYYVPTRAF